MGYIQQSQGRWKPLAPGDTGWDSRLVPVDLSGLYWTDCQTPGAEYTSWNYRFMPDYSPMSMMGMGIFGDAYWGDPLGQNRKSMLPQNYPFIRGDREYTNTRGVQCKRVNCYGRPASLTRDWWLDRGLIFDADPLGWFEWYCWYWMGRRIDDYDDHQIQRWASFRMRQRSMYAARPVPGTAQAMLHWAIDAN